MKSLNETLFYNNPLAKIWVAEDNCFVILIKLAQTVDLLLF